MPLIVHSVWRAPARTAAKVFAAASPRSLWQWAENTAFSEFFTLSNRVFIRSPNSVGGGVAHGIRDVDGGGPGFDGQFAALTEEINFRAGGVLRRPFYVICIFSGFFYRAFLWLPSTVFGDIRSLCLMWSGLVEMKVCIRFLAAGLRASAAASMSRIRRTGQGADGRFFSPLLLPPEPQRNLPERR